MSYIWCFGGHRVSLTDPRPEQIRIEDIARALSQTNRWTGHTSKPFSTAQHSVYVAKMVPPPDKLAGLLHDSAEFALGDVSSPLKKILGHTYRELERHMLGVIGERFGVDLVNLPASVREADHRMMLMEARALVQVPHAEMVEHFGHVPDNLSGVCPWSAFDAETMFMHYFAQFGGRA